MVREYKRIWDSSPVLRRFYRDIWAWAWEEVTLKPVVELGGGAGLMRERYPELFSTDLLPFPNTTLQCDATRLPFRPESVGCFVGIAFFHHCTALRTLLEEAQTALQPGGRMVLIDPYISPLSRWIYRFATDEAVDLSEKPLETQAANAGNPLLDANVARATLVFLREREAYDRLFPAFQIKSVECINFFRHIAAGSCVQQFPAAPLVYPPACLVDRLLHPIRRYTGMCMKVVLEKTP